MELTNQIIFIGSAVLLFSVLASVITTRVGIPLLLVFLALGMLLGEEGPGGVRFDDVQSAHLFGSLALAIILFDGGLRTPAKSFRVGLRPAIGLATVGVLITAAATGLFAAWMLDLGWIEGLLIGAIVGSTDAAAVFALLHSRGLELKERVGATLEIESGSNDPMAIFLTIALVEVLLLGEGRIGASVALDFVQQMGLGALVGWIGGLALAVTINRVSLTPGLYPLAAFAGALLVFGLASVLGGSGFLAVYLAGLLLGNRPLQASQNISRFHDGIARLAQIGMFLMLGLLATPSDLLPVALESLAIAGVLILLARPLAVWLCLLPFHFPWREQVFVGWVGLRGAVPIILALFPLLAGLDNAWLFFNVAFFVVLVSLLVQGWTVTPAARLLGLEVPPVSQVIQRVELDIPGQQEIEMVGYRLARNSPVVSGNWRSFVLPESVRVIAHIRDQNLLPTVDLHHLQADDLLYLLAARKDLAMLDRLFVASAAPEHLSEQKFFGEFVLNGDARLSDVALMYGVPVDEAYADRTLERHIEEELQVKPVVGDRVRVGRVELVVRELDGARISRVGLKLSG
ncbi:MAG: potassium/proton antiporter [Chromatiales bacterium]|nr:potassium/proton antiporter [Chromatiales bacterium]